jgi:hypothetical protein
MQTLKKILSVFDMVLDGIGHNGGASNVIPVMDRES